MRSNTEAAKRFITRHLGLNTNEIRSEEHKLTRFKVTEDETDSLFT